MAEERLELTVEETNELRAELGLKPLRVGNGAAATPSAAVSNTNGVREGEEELLDLSVNETNKLREKLGLAPLKSGAGESGGANGRKEVVFQQTENLGEKEEAAKRIERARLQREVQEGVSQVFGSSTLASDEAEHGDAALSWAEKMRQQRGTSKMPAEAAAQENKKNGNNKKTKKSSRTSRKQEAEYSVDDLAGMQVKNSMAQLEAGGETVLTLADTSILETRTSVSSKVVGLNEDEDALENVNLTEREKQEDGLRKKRMLEMGMGRAGGYAGFDDEEFEELGGTLGPSRQERGGGNDYQVENEEKSKNRGFRIGSEKDALANASMTDYDKVQSGKAVSLVGVSDVAASDFMTIEEAEEEIKREVKFKKKKKKKDKKKRKRKTSVEEEDEEDVQAQLNPESGISLLAQLEQNAPSEETSGLGKRRRNDDGEEDNNPDAASSAQQSEVEKPQSKRAKYDEIMEKGNARTRLAFGESKPASEKVEHSIVDEEEDDSFLNAALAKARRLNRLRAMNKGAQGAEAVVAAINTANADENISKQSSGTMSFSVDDTREFSRALRARTEQKQRETQKQSNEMQSEKTPQVKTEAVAVEEKEVQVEDVEDEEDVDMEELAKEVKTDDMEPSTMDGSTASKVGVGRGLSSFVSMLKTTGEIKGKHGGKEELRGRAKDERNYDNYEALDLSQVVKIGKNATDKDREFANREIKLEYRDKHGRLLTQKAAYRELCYQFHGHGASKKNEEKRLKQIAREQAEARVASRQVAAARDGKTAGTTLGALKATQKATGKAFVVHKT